MYSKGICIFRKAPRLWRRPGAFHWALGKSRGLGRGKWYLFGFPVTVPASPERLLAGSIYAKVALVDSLLGALGLHLVTKLLQDGAKMAQDSRT